MLSEQGEEERRKTLSTYCVPALTQHCTRHLGVIFSLYPLLHPVRERYFPQLTYQEIES